VQDRNEFNPAAGPGVAVREFPLKTGYADYLLLVDRNAVGVVEAKKLGTLLTPKSWKTWRRRWSNSARS
jgi:type I restriction enzyme, R subunit